jgi:hypothetical protein
MSTPNRIPACFAIASMLAGLGTAAAQPLPAPGSATPPTTPPKAGPAAPPKAPAPVGPTAPPKAPATQPAPKAGPSKAAPTPEAREAAAKAYFERGSAYYAAGDYLLARAEFAAGYELSGRPLFLFNMAECSRLNGDLDQARAGYERYLREAPTGSQVGLAKERLSAMKQPKPEPKPQPAAGPVYGPRPATPVASAPQIGPQPPVLGPQPPTKSAIGSSSECTAEGGCASSGRTKRLAGLGVGGGGVLLIFAGMYYWRRAANLGGEVTDACANGCDWATVSDDYEASKSAERRQWTMLGFGTAALAAGGVLYWLGMKEEAAAAKVVIVPREGGAAVSWGGRW